MIQYQNINVFPNRHSSRLESFAYSAPYIYVFLNVYNE